MQRQLLKSKIHRAIVTEADLHYEGSITIDEEIMKAAKIIPNEHVHVWDVSNGNRFETYALPGPAGSKVICINGAAAHLASKNDIVIITSFALFDEAEIETHKPTVLLIGDNNEVKSIL